MKHIIKIFIVNFLLVSSCLAQLSLEKFWSVELGSSLSAVKQIFPNEKWEEKEAGSDILYFFFDRLEPSYVKVSFLFTSKDQLRMKSISNGKVNKESAKLFFLQMKEIVTKQFGSKYEQKETAGKRLFMWRRGKDGRITLSIEGSQSILIALEAVGIPF